MAYYTKKELTKIGLDGFALIDEFNYGRGRNAAPPPRKKHLPNNGGHLRPLPVPAPPAAATPAVAINHYYSTASSISGNNSRRFYQQGYYNYRYSPAESHVGWTPVTAVTMETTTVIRGGGYDGGEILMDNYKY